MVAADKTQYTRGTEEGRGNETGWIAFCGNAKLRSAIRNNTVTFPSQMIRLGSRADGDRSDRIVQLYFVRGWSVWRICERYRLSRTKVDAILNRWRNRAIAAGFVQEIPVQREIVTASANTTVAGQCTPVPSPTDNDLQIGHRIAVTFRMTPPANDSGIGRLHAASR